MTADERDDQVERLRRHVRALAAVNRQLHAQLTGPGAGPRASGASTWIEELQRNPTPTQPVLVRRADRRVELVEGGVRRPIPSGVLAAALAHLLGEPRDLDDEEIAGWPQSAPVEVLEGPSGAPFVLVGGRRLPLRGLPLPNAVTAAEMQVFPQGPELNVSLATRPLPSSGSAPVTAFALPGDDDDLPLPTFLIIGAQKSATRWLRANLKAHPDIFMAPSEGVFFSNQDRYERLGLRWYRAQFDGWQGEPVVGESTPAYLMWNHDPQLVADRILETLPDVRLVALLRNPIDRAHSAMIHHIGKGRLDPDSDLREVVRARPPEEDPLGIVTGGWYAASLEPYLERFGDRLLVLLNDDLADGAAAVYAEVLRHVGADPTFEPPDLEQVRFSNRADDEIRWEPLDQAARVELYELFRDDVDRLAALLGRDLAAWDPTRNPVPDVDEPEVDEPGDDADGSEAVTAGRTRS